jgi:hypothetical protein
MKDDYQVNLPQPLIEQLREGMQKSPFSSLDDFILFILQDYLDRTQLKAPAPEITEEVTRRLKGLGYL